MRVLVCGSRTWTDEATVRRELERFKPTVVIHGACPRGADAIADRVAREMGLMVERFPAEWEVHGRAAGPIRNQRMLEDGRPDMVLAFRATGKSNGTDDMVDRATWAGVDVVLVRDTSVLW